METEAVYRTEDEPIESARRTLVRVVYALSGREGNTAKRHFLECFSLPHRPQRYAGHFCLSRLWGLLASGKLQLIPNFISPRDQSGGRCPAHDRARRCDASSPDGFSPSERTRLRGTLFSPLRSSSVQALLSLYLSISLSLSLSLYLSISLSFSLSLSLSLSVCVFSSLRDRRSRQRTVTENLTTTEETTSRKRYPHISICSSNFFPPLFLYTPLITVSSS